MQALPSGDFGSVILIHSTSLELSKLQRLRYRIHFLAMSLQRQVYQYYISVSPSNSNPSQEAKGLLVNITGGSDMTLFEVDEAAAIVTEV